MRVETPSDDASSLAYLRRRRYARTCTLRFLYQADLSGQWEFPAGVRELFWDQCASLDDAPEGKELEDARDYATRLIEGVLANREKLDAEITAGAHNWRLGRMGMVDRNLLRLAGFEILVAREVPPVAAINEAIELAKEFGDKDSSRFVNGVLDRLAKLTGEDKPEDSTAG
jgi:N utilization substance protein B